MEFTKEKQLYWLVANPRSFTAALTSSHKLKILTLESSTIKLPANKTKIKTHKSTPGSLTAAVEHVNNNPDSLANIVPLFTRVVIDASFYIAFRFLEIDKILSV